MKKLEKISLCLIVFEFGVVRNGQTDRQTDGQARPVMRPICDGRLITKN